MRRRVRQRVSCESSLGQSQRMVATDRFVIRQAMNMRLPLWFWYLLVAFPTSPACFGRLGSCLIPTPRASWWTWCATCSSFRKTAWPRWWTLNCAKDGKKDGLGTGHEVLETSWNTLVPWGKPWVHWCKKCAVLSLSRSWAPAVCWDGAYPESQPHTHTHTHTRSHQFRSEPSRKCCTQLH